MFWFRMNDAVLRVHRSKSLSCINLFIIVVSVLIIRYAIRIDNTNHYTALKTQLGLNFWVVYNAFSYI